MGMGQRGSRVGEAAEARRQSSLRWKGDVQVGSRWKSPRWMVHTREGPLWLGGGPRTGLTPQGCEGQDQTPRPWPS